MLPDCMLLNNDFMTVRDEWISTGKVFFKAWLNVINGMVRRRNHLQAIIEDRQDENKALEARWEQEDAAAAAAKQTQINSCSAPAEEVRDDTKSQKSTSSKAKSLKSVHFDEGAVELETGCYAQIEVGVQGGMLTWHEFNHYKKLLEIEKACAKLGLCKRETKAQIKVLNAALSKVPAFKSLNDHFE